MASPEKRRFAAGLSAWGARACLTLLLLASMAALVGGSCGRRRPPFVPQVPISLTSPADGSRFTVGDGIVFAGSVALDPYLTETHASVSPFGDRIVFRSNWDDPNGAVDAYVISLDAAPVTDTDPHATPSIPRPAYLAPITDPVFGQTVTRITDAARPIYNPTGDPSLEGKQWDFQSGHGYSSRVVWNADQSLLLMRKGVGGEVFLDGTTFEPRFQRDTPGGSRWHPTDPASMVFVDEGARCVGTYLPVSDVATVSRCFTGYDRFDWSDPGKATPSPDGNVVPIRARRSLDGHWVAFLYHFDTDVVSAEIDMTPFVEAGDEPDFTMSPEGDVVIINGCVIGHEGDCEAQLALDVSTQAVLWQVSSRHDPGHADEFIDASGEQWRVGLAKAGAFEDQIIKRNFRTGVGVSILPFWGSHTSTRNLFDPRGIAVVSYHEPAGPLRNEIVGVCIDGSCLERYAHTHRAEGADGAVLAQQLEWGSSLDGPLATGSSFSTSSLSQGSHTIRADLWDAGTLLSSAQLDVEILGSDVTILAVAVSASSDDAEERASGSMRLTSSDLELVFDAGGDQTVGTRFTGVTLPPGATITHAFVQFHADQEETGPTSLLIRGELSTDATPFLSSDFDLTSRSVTAAGVAWSPPPWTTAGEAGPGQRTPDLAAILQEIVDTPGWLAGNSLALLISGSGERTAEAFDGSPAGAPLLHVEYQSP